jgi:hypothetical protein
MKYTLQKAVLLSALVLLLGTVHSAKADGLQIVCTGSTTCTSGGIETTTSTNPSFDVQLVGNGNGSENGELWIAILVPTTSGANFTAPDNSSMWTALNEGSGGSDHNFGSTTGNNPFFTASDQGFLVSDRDTGQMLTGSQTSSVIVPGSFAAGTMFVAFTENADDNIAADSPWSESLLITGATTGGTTTGGTTTGGTTGGTTGSPVPEPGTLMLLGSGLSMAGILKRRFLFGTVQ